VTTAIPKPETIRGVAFVLLLIASVSLMASQPTVSTEDTREPTRLEGVWNEAHVHGDVPTLDGLCADDPIVTVSEMPTFFSSLLCFSGAE
jgi:hypothetical protein